VSNPAVTIDFLANMENFSKGLSQVTGKLEQMAITGASGAGGIGALGGALGGIMMAAAPLIATVAGVAAAIGTVGLAMDKAAQKQTLLKQFELIMGSAEEAKKRVNEIEDLAPNTVFSEDQLVAASAAMTKLGGNAAGSAENVMLVGDAAAALGPEKFNELTESVARVKAGLSGGLPLGRSLISLAMMGALSGDTVKKLNDMKKAGASGDSMWAVAQKDLARFDGSMKKMAEGTFAGAMQSLGTAIGGAFEDILESVGMPIIEALTPAIVAVKNWVMEVKPMVLGFIDGIKDGVSTVINLFTSGGITEAFWLALQVGAAGAVEWLLGALITVFQTAVEVLTMRIMRLGDPSYWTSMLQIFGSIPTMILGALGMLGSVLLQTLSGPLDFLAASMQWIGGILTDALYSAGMGLKGILLDAALLIMNKMADISAKVGIDLTGAVTSLENAKKEHQQQTSLGVGGTAESFAEKMQGVKDKGGVLGMAGVDPEKSFQASEQVVKAGWDMGAAGLSTQAKQLGEDVVAPIKDNFDNMKPVEIYDTDAQATRLKSMWEEAKPKDKDQAGGKEKKPDAATVAAEAAVVADSLTSIGGGGGIAGMGAGVGMTPVEEQTAAVTTQTALVQEQTSVQGQILGVLTASKALLEAIVQNTKQGGGGGGGLTVEAT
jgi:hypothetical protein